MPDRKLFAYGFLSGAAAVGFIPTGSCSRKVSYSTGYYGVSCRRETVRIWFPTERDSNAVSYRQETFRIWFPARHDTAVFLADRKLFAYSFLLSVAPMLFLTDRKLFAYGFLLSVAPMCFLPTGNCLPGDFSTPLRSARNDRAAWPHCVSYRQETFCPIY